MKSKLLEFIEQTVNLSRRRKPAVFAKPQNCLRVATFNAHFAKNVTAIAQAFARNANLAAADIILIQEIEHLTKENATRASRLAKLLNMDYVYVPSRRLLLMRGTHGTAILSRYYLRNAKAIRLPVYPLLRLHPRVALCAEVQYNGRKVKIYNIHLSGSLNYRQRASQLDAVLKHIRRQNTREPVILAGDFNTIPLLTLVGTSIPLFYSNQRKKLHAFLGRQGFISSGRYIGHTSNWGLARFQLDGIYARGAAFSQSGIERSIKISDHFPLWADIKIR